MPEPRKKREMNWLVIGILGGLGLCLILRLAVLPCFIVPTGSMAPALPGEHIEAACASCGWTFPVGVPQTPLALERLKTSAVEARCPGCGAMQRLPVDASLRQGSHILTLPARHPVRWSVIAHKNPTDLNVTNVSRVVGLPGETIELHDGDVFVNGKRALKDPGTAPDMWIPVHDTRCRPSGSPSGAATWKPGRDSCWTAAVAGWGFESDGPCDDALEFTGKVTDELAYAALYEAQGTKTPHAPVSDVKVECCLREVAGAVHIAFEWERAGRKVRALATAAGEVRIAAGGAAASGRLRRPLGAEATLAFALRDGTAFLLEAGEPAVSVVVLPESLSELDAAEAPGAMEAARLRILAGGGRVSISWIGVSRDVHYRQRLHLPGTGIGCRGSPITLGPREYFVLGDNSEFSFDSRWWETLDPRLRGKCQPGAVPEDALVGRVLRLW